MDRTKTTAIFGLVCKYCHRKISQCDKCSNTFLENDIIYCDYGPRISYHICESCKVVNQ